MPEDETSPISHEPGGADSQLTSIDLNNKSHLFVTVWQETNARSANAASNSCHFSRNLECLFVVWQSWKASLLTGKRTEPQGSFNRN